MPEISDEQKDATLAALSALNAELVAEKQRDKDAAAWRTMRSMSISTLRYMAYNAATTDELASQIAGI